MDITVKMARVNAGKTQEQAAQHLGLSLTGYQKKESGRSKFYVDEIVSLSELFGVDCQIFFKALCRKKTRTTA